LIDSHRPQASGCHEASWQPIGCRAGLPGGTALFCFSIGFFSGEPARRDCCSRPDPIGAKRPSSPGACRIRDETEGSGEGRTRARGAARRVPAAPRDSGSPRRSSSYCLATPQVGCGHSASRARQLLPHAVPPAAPVLPASPYLRHVFAGLPSYPRPPPPALSRLLQPVITSTVR